jgi:hypothetical protein
MKKAFMLFLIMTVAACATVNPKPETLHQETQCKVWREDTFGIRHVATVEGELARQKMTCWILDTFLCSYTDYTYRENTSEILSSIGDHDKTIAKLEGQKLSVNMNGVSVDPFELKGQKASYMLQGPFGPKQNKTVEYNKNCTTRQAALGLLTILSL